jgi:predicted nuclease with TOPRIM domain
MNNEAIIKKLDRLEDRIETLEEENQRLREENASLREHVTTEIEGRLTALSKRTGANRDRIAELQSRELEKGAHLIAENVQPEILTVEEGHVERFEKESGPHVRIPGSEDALERGGTTTLAHRRSPPNSATRPVR